jgi:replicative DNA helicase
MSTSPESEIAVVGSLILDSENVGVVRRIISSGDFTDPYLGDAFALLCGLHDDGLPIADTTLLVERFRRADLLEAIGGVHGIGRIVLGCPNASHAEHYAGEIRSASTRRKLKSLADTLANRAVDPTADPARVIEWAESQLQRYGDGGDRVGSISRLQPAASLFVAYIDRIKRGDLPQLCRLGSALDGIEVGPELITIVGAPPGAGKTCMASKVMFEACEHDKNLVAYLLNAEMGFDAIARRELTRLTRIKSDYIRFGALTAADIERIDEAAETLTTALQRVSVYPDPSVESLHDLLDKPPGLVVVDYLQKFAPAEKDVRVGVGQVMNVLRRLANCGHAVLALSATKRDAKGGHNSADLSLSSFKESGDVEFQADSAYVLRDNGPLEVEWVRHITLGHVKNRHGAKVDRDLRFHMPSMDFEPYEQALATHAEFDEFATESPFCFGGDE